MVQNNEGTLAHIREAERRAMADRKALLQSLAMRGYADNPEIACKPAWRLHGAYTVSEHRVATPAVDHKSMILLVAGARFFNFRLSLAA